MAEKKKEETKPTHVVKTEFRDINDWDTVHEVGKDVSDFDADRLTKLVANGHVEDLRKPEPPADPPA